MASRKDWLLVRVRREVGDEIKQLGLELGAQNIGGKRLSMDAVVEFLVSHYKTSTANVPEGSELS